MSDTTNYFQSNSCTPALRTNIATSGLMTVCDLHVPGPDELEALLKVGGDYTLIDPVFLWQWEANANMAEQSNLFKYLMANRVNMAKKLQKDTSTPGLLRIMPYVNVKRRNPINNNFWKAVTGTAVDADGTVNASGTHWRLDFSSMTSIPVHIGWFNPPEWVFINGMADDGTSIKWAGQIVSRAVVGSAVRVVLLPQMNNSALPAARKANPTTGLATRGVANVSSFESFCAQPPGLIEGVMQPYWIGETRWSFKEDQLYNEWRDLVLSGNKLYSEIFDLPTRDYNKQVSEGFAQKHVESFFNNTAYLNQDTTTIDLLDEINTSVDSIGGVRCVGKRANPIGIYEQYAQCDRVRDAQGQPLNIPALAQALNKMSRVRKASGAPVGSQKVFEIGMPGNYLPAFHQGMLRYYDAQWDGKVTWSLNIQDMAKRAPMGFTYLDYPLVWPAGASIRIVLDDYFDDYASAMHQMAVDTGDERWDNLGRRLWIADWSRIYMGIFGSKRITNNPGRDLVGMQNMGVFDPCVMETVQETNTLIGFTWTAVADATLGDLLIENFSGAVPEHSAIGGVDYEAEL